MKEKHDSETIKILVKLLLSERKDITEQEKKDILVLVEEIYKNLQNKKYEN